VVLTGLALNPKLLDIRRATSNSTSRSVGAVNRYGADRGRETWPVDERRQLIMEVTKMEALVDLQILKKLGGLIILLAVAALNACYSQPYGRSESQLAQQDQELEKLKSAEYQDSMSAMRFEDSDQKLGNYYITKTVQVHRLIDQLEKGQPATDAEITHALDTSDADKYDNRPPVPLDDEIGNGY
jgi:hypothetical protein